MDTFGNTDGFPKPGGFLSNLDSQQLLTWDNLTEPGAWNDNDMLYVCHGGQTMAEYTSQFSTWSILASPLILGNDIRTMTPECLAIITNKEVVAVNQDLLGVRGRLALQWPVAEWPPVDPPAPFSSGVPLSGSAPPAPPPLGALVMAPCNASDPAQLFTYSPKDSLLRSAAGGGMCLTYGGYSESNLSPTACTGWTSPGIGSQLWVANATRGTLVVVDNTEKLMDVLDCSFAPGTVQVCTGGGADCYTHAPGPPGCGLEGQRWAFDFANGAPSTIASAVAAASAPHCVAVTPPPPPPIDIRLQVWVKPLSDASVAVVAFNRDARAVTANVTWDLMGWPAAQQATVRDLWLHEDLGTFAGVVSAPVESHSVWMLRITPLAG